jgi:single-strand DNA-binding protein
MIRVHGVVRLTHEPVLKDVGTTKVCTFQVALNENRKNAQGEYQSIGHFFNCVLWDTGAEKFVETMKKGDQFFIEDGELRDERWTDKDGTNHKNVVIRVNRFVKPARTAQTEDS